MTQHCLGVLSRLVLTRATRPLAVLALLCGCAQAIGQPVEHFSPQGEVKGIRQATARFGQPMVPFGDPRELDPFTVDCVEKGSGRWADTRNWVYDFARDLPAGVRCSFTLKPGLHDVAGAALATGPRFEFSTGGPAIVRSLPYEGSRIDENQVFILGLDAPVKPDTVTAHAHCVAAGVNEEIGVRLVTGDERKTILDNRKSFAASYLRVLFVDGGEGRTRGLLFRLPTTGSDQDKFLRLRDAPDSPLVTLACARTLPAGAEVKLVWGKGIAATTGVATSATQALAYKVRPTFRASFTCDRVNKDAQCIPILPLTLSFTALIAKADAAKIRMVDAAGKTYLPNLPKAADGNWLETVTFGPGLPEKQQFRIEIPEGLKDDAGRVLANARSFPLKVRTDEHPPLVKFAADFGILERVLPGGETPLLPVTVRNVEPVLPGQQAAVRDALKAAAKGASAKDAPIPGQVVQVKHGDEMQIVAWLRRLAFANKIEREFDDKTEKWTVTRNGFAQSVFKSGDTRTKIAVPKPLGAKAFEVIGIPLPKAGFYVVELASPKLGAALLGEPKPFYVRAATLVTNLAVHIKLGRESSLVWVTQLNDATPVANAAVAVRDCGGKSHWEGRTDAAGIARVNRELPERESLPSCGTEDSLKEFFVTARTDDDLSYAFSNWGEGISPWRFNVPTGNYSGPYLAHAVLDRSLVRAGETVSMKLFVRQQTGNGFALPPRKGLDDTLLIRHLGSEKEYRVPVQWTGTGSPTSGEASFEVPKDAYAGTYQINVRDTLAPNSKAAQERAAGTFRVEAFRVPLLRARLQAVGVPLVNPPDVNLDVQISYLAGGGAGGLPVTVRTQVDGKLVTFPDFDDYAFAAGNVKEGREEQGDTSARFDGFTFSDPDLPDADSDVGRSARPLRGTDLTLTLDRAGGARATIRNIEKSEQPRDLIAELEYRDPNGETLTAATRVALWPAKIVLGIKPDSWVASKERLKFTVVAVDLAGKPVAGVRVRADAFKRDAFSHRRRLIGGFYAYEHGYDTTRAGDLCSGATDSRGLLICEMPPPATGNLIVRAQAADADGRAVVTRADTWVTADDDQWFGASDNDRIDLLPEKKRYEPGSVARFQLRTPFKDATVLVTVEREGVLDAFVRTVNRGDPVLEVPIKGNYAPNIFVSAFLVRGRIGDVAPTALIDLAKPSFKMGLTELRVGWATHELAVKVTPARATYKVRDKASATITVRRPDGSAPPKGSEVALAAIDEGLLELLPNNSWKLLDAMMARRGEEVETATAQMQVIGKRHFGRKAIAPGGGGGRASSRELFDTLLLWKARVPLDDAGNATVEIPLNDSLTSFRIVAVASSGAGLFGTGEASIRSTQSLMLLSGLPPLVREGDRFRATFTVRNASERPLDIALAARVTAAGAALPALEPRTAQLAPGEARELNWEMTAPANASALNWQIDATERGTAPTPVHDALKITQKVVPAVPERTYQATILQLTQPQEIAVQRPADALPGRGGVNVQVQARLAGELPGVRDFFEKYVFSCFEQQASIAIGLRDLARWNALMSRLPDYLDRDGMVKYWPVMQRGDDTLTAYVMSVAGEAGWMIPERERDRMEQALIGFVEGRLVRFSALPTADLSIRKIAALEALSRRDVPLNAKWLDSIAIEPNRWPTSAVIDWYLILKRQAQLPQRDARMKAAEQILRSRLNFQGTTMGFSTEKTDALWWLMVSADSNANKLLLALNDVPAWKEDMPRMVRGSLGRMQRGHWNTTVANAWGTLALDKFSARFEAAPVTGTTVATLAGTSFTHQWKADDAAKTFAQKLPWPAGRESVSLKQDGTGTPWVTLQSIAAIPLTTAMASGYQVTRTVTPIQQQTKNEWRRGDIARIRLDVSAQSDMAWVVVDDPLPAGSTALGRGLGGDSTLATQGEQKQGTVWPAFEERTFTAYRAYFRFVPKGRFVVEYTVRLNNPGVFNLPATRVEAMYAPEMFAELPNAAWTVLP